MNILRLVCLASLLLSSPASAMVKVDVAAASIAQNEPLHLTIESDAPLASALDLGPLEQDFTIIQHSASHSTRSFNGQTRQRTVLHLGLLPRRSGDLTIPALRIGEETSRPIQVRVTPIADAIPAVPQSQPAPAYDPSYAPPTTPDWTGGPGMENWGTPLWGGGPGGLPGWGPIPDHPGGAVATPEPATSPTTEDHGSAGPGLWPWFAGIALAGWLLTALALWRQRSRGTATTPANTPAPTPSAPPPPTLEELIAEVRQAYQGDDPFAARDALLRWAARVWPEDTPGNLSRLAARCPSQLQRPILRLEQALYSPFPIPWNELPVWELLEGVAQAGPAAGGA